MEEVFDRYVQNQESNGSSFLPNQSEETVDSINAVENDEQQSESKVCLLIYL